MNQINWKEILAKCFGKEKDERMHAIAMLLIYGVFILILIIVIRTQPPIEQPTNTETTPSPTTTPEVTPTEKEESTTEIENYEINYSYIYTVQNNGQKEVFTGKKLDDKEIFTIIDQTGSKNYAKLSDNYLIKENNDYHIIDSPSTNLIYTDLNTLVELAESGQLVRNDNVYTYTISTSSIVKEYNPELTLAIAETLTDTMIVTLENDQIKKIEINFNNYQRTVQNNANSILLITMEFNNIGTTEDFDVTISN